MLMLLLCILGYLLAPILLIFLCQKFQWLDKIGTVVLAFGLGILLAVILPYTTIDKVIEQQQLLNIQTSLSEISIALALPLLVFSIDVKHAFKTANHALKSMGLALFSVVFISTLVTGFFYHVYDDAIENLWQVAGLAVGAYTGSNINMGAIKTAINANQDTFIIMTTYDILLSALYVLFIITLAKPLFSRFLAQPSMNTRHNINQSNNQSNINQSKTSQSKTDQTNIKFTNIKHSTQQTNTKKTDQTDIMAKKYAYLADESAHSFRVLIKSGHKMSVLWALICSAMVVGMSVLLASFFPESMASVVTIVAITSLGIVASFLPAIRKLTGSFQLGMYFILLFGFSMGSMTNINLLTDLNFYLFAYISMMLSGAMILHALLCKIFDIDVDTFLITSTAAILSLPFVPIVASSLKNRALLVPGFIAAILGYILGNYLGILVAYLSRWVYI